MAHPDVEAAFKARLQAGFSEFVADAPPVMEEGLFTVPKDQSAFIVIQFPFNENWQRTFPGPDGRHFTEEGGVRFVINARRTGNVGTVQDGKRWAADIAKLFRGAEFDGVRCFAPTSPIGDNSNDQGGYYTISVVVDYEFTFLEQD